MLIRMLPEQVEQAWDYYKAMLGEALPPYVRDNQQGMTNILTAILLEQAVVWAYLEENVVHGIVVTYIHSHDLTRQKQLEIYAVYATENLTPARYVEALETLKRYGRQQGCQIIIGYVDDEQWARFLRMRGATVDWKLVEIPL